jgi:hypothetical protein
MTHIIRKEEPVLLIQDRYLNGRGTDIDSESIMFFLHSEVIIRHGKLKNKEHNSRFVAAHGSGAASGERLHRMRTGAGGACKLTQRLFSFII